MMLAFRFVTSTTLFLGAVTALSACAASDDIGFSEDAAGPQSPSVVEEGPPLDPDGVSMYTETASDPFSTFAADVDTASYDLFRSRLENSGMLIEPREVRAEEFINSFDYDYEAPSWEDRDPFRIDVAAAVNFLESPRALLRVGIQAKTPPPEEDRPANLAFLVDVSGSMQDPTKLPLVKTLLLETLKVVDPSDRVAIVTYAGGTRVALPSTPVLEGNIHREIIESLSAAGSTNGAGGLDLAYREVQSSFVEGGINHVILCTDGDFNVGPSSVEELVALIEEKRASGITFTAVGFGTQPNDGLMESISNRGNGIYGVVGTPNQAVEYARERMLASLHLVAKDVKIQVEFNPEHVFAYRLLGYENRALADEDFRRDAVDAGEVGAGHRVTALYELALTEAALPDGVEAAASEAATGGREIAADDLVLVKLRYKALDASEEDPASELRNALPAGDFEEPDLDLMWAGGVAYFAELLKESPYVSPSILPELDSIIETQGSRDARRATFENLYGMARPMLESRHIAK